ncbi:Hypothetical predicted protein [Paramuricea clavata]|uniref:Integrase core domain-containing protein n=1 Tax=Paramuricea clavata TaxID=317549 RepID=A0A7D9EQU4_PARCT|nr:Hypothetical predicted protein [Paramuricea clavata]
MLSDDSESEEENEPQEIDEESIITYYFNCGFSYEEIRGFANNPNSNCIVEQVRQRIRELINGPASSGGYRTVWHTLEMEGLRVPRIVVQDILKELDPEGTEWRKAHRFKRREYHNPGPNYAWHMDGYDKLKPWGFPIHGAIDGFSRKILWLNVTRSNNSPDNIAKFYLKTVEEHKGCPVEMVTDLGTENGLVAATQCYFRDNHDAHRYVPSPRNQRIEAWWSFFSRNRSTWWRNFFSDLESREEIDLSYDLSKECMWYCFHDLLQKDIDTVKEHWNTHRIRRSRYNTVPGRPDSLFYFPESHGGVSNLLKEVPEQEINYAYEEIVQMNQVNEYQEYFEYAREALGLPRVPVRDTQEACELYERIKVDML